MNLIPISIKGISYSQTQTGAYALILSEEKSNRKLPIIIGGFEAQSIAIALEKEIDPPRPLTHDLFKSFADLYKLQIKHVVIHKLEDGVFYSNIYFYDVTGKEQIMDSRTSDAIALAVRFESPIYTTEKILEKAGIYLEDISDQEISDIESEIESIGESGNQLANISIQELNKRLKKALKEENYELAVQIRDELSKRK